MYRLSCRGSRQEVETLEALTFSVEKTKPPVFLLQFIGRVEFQNVIGEKLKESRLEVTESRLALV